MRQPDAPRIIRHALFGVTQQGVSIAVGLLLLPYMLSHLGSERYGLLLMLQIVSISGVLIHADAGLYFSLTRFLAQNYVTRNDAEFRAVLATGILAFLALGVIFAAIVFAFGELAFANVFQVPQEYAADMRFGVRLYAASFLLQLPIMSVKAFYAGVQRLGLLRLWEMIERIGYAIAMVVLLLFSTRIVHIVIVEQLTLFLVFVAFCIVARKAVPTLFRPTWSNASVSRLRVMWPMSREVLINRLSFLAYQRAPEVVTAAVLGPVALAWYGIIMKVPRALKGLSANAATFAGAAALDSLDQHERLARLILRGARYLYLVLTPLFAFLFVFADQVLTLWVGSEYQHLANLLRAGLAWQYIMFFVFHINSTFTRPEQFRRCLPYTLPANAIFLIAVIATISRFALWSIMAGLLVSASLTAIGWARVQSRSTGIRPRQYFDQVLLLPVLGVGTAATSVFASLRLAVETAGLAPLAGMLAVTYAVYAPVVFRFVLQPPEQKHVLRALGRAR